MRVLTRLLAIAALDILNHFGTHSYTHTHSDSVEKHQTTYKMNYAELASSVKTHNFILVIISTFTFLLLLLPLLLLWWANRRVTDAWTDPTMWCHLAERENYERKHTFCEHFFLFVFVSLCALCAYTSQSVYWRVANVIIVTFYPLNPPFALDISDLVTRLVRFING